jgi:hypothetical protein
MTTTKLYIYALAPDACPRYMAAYSPSDVARTVFQCVAWPQCWVRREDGSTRWVQYRVEDGRVRRAKSLRRKP